METRTPVTEPSRPAWRNPWIIGWVLIIVVIVSVNSFMIYLAVGTNPGLVVEDYYDRGRNYEKTVLTRQALGRRLSLQVDVPSTIERGKPATFVFTGTDKAGRPIRIDAVTLHAYRPSNCDHDFSLLMTKAEGVSEGAAQSSAGEGKVDRYLAEVMFPLKGVWDIIVAVEHAGNEHNVARRIMVADR